MPKPKVFIDEEIQSMRDSINSLRSPGSYEPGKWMVSALNRDPRLIGTGAPRRVKIRDITLRTIEQTSGVTLTREQRKQLLAAIVKTGVPEVMLSMFGRGYTLDEIKSEVDLVKQINNSCIVVYTGASQPEQIELAARAGIDVVQAGASPVSGLAPARMGGAYRHHWEGRDWRTIVARTKEGHFERLTNLIAAGKRTGVRISCAVNQLSYASEQWVADFAQTVSSAGAESVLLADGSSGCGPEVFAQLTKVAKEHSKGLPVIVHTHNVFNMAVGNALAATLAGADSAEVAVNGYSASAGQADLAHLALSLEALYGIETGIDLGQMTALSRLGEELAGHPIAFNYPVTGPEVFNWGGSDSIVGELDIDTLLHWNIEPTLVGNVRKWEITRGAGPYTMWQKLDDLGIEAEKDEIEPILHACWKVMEGQKHSITDHQIRQVVAEVRSSGPVLATGTKEMM